jgi:tRNA threonylcarbamoyladenosine biosynthesis protein TsaB
MLILLLKTDQPQAELYLCHDQEQLAHKVWNADRTLAGSLLSAIEALLKQNHKRLDQVEAVGVFSGPGSFTGLRIGHSVANTLAYSLKVPIVGASGRGWRAEATTKLCASQNDRIALPEYGSDAKTTAPRK